MYKGIGPNGLGSPNKMCKSPMKMKGEGSKTESKLEGKMSMTHPGEKDSPMKQTTYGEFMHQKHVKDMEMGKATKPIDKVKAAYDAMTTDKTYAEAKQGYRNERKKEYAAKQAKK